ncbi:MAG: histidinol dehydrogenase [Opitutales bacterium]
MRTLRYASRGFWKRFAGQVAATGGRATVGEIVTRILNEVEAEGDPAVLRYTREFDKTDLARKGLRVPVSALANAAEAMPADERRIIRQALAEVRSFHKRSLPKDWSGQNRQGGSVGERHFPIRRVGLYIPGGSVPLVSSVLMNTVPAQVAGVPEIAVATPPVAGGDGLPAAPVLAALHLCGIEEVYSMGGVQAVGALAFGTSTVPAVDKVCGPGNAFVNEAKRQVFGRVGIDLQPGPSEVMVIADSTAKPAFVAADLLAQAEHGTGKEKAYAVFTDPALIDPVKTEIRKQLRTLSHAAAIRQVLDNHTFLIEVPDLEAAAAVANFVAPEHLELQVADRDLEPLTRKITTAGAIMQGHLTPTVLGDFTAGPSHTLPTDRTGRFFSGLRTADFLRRSSVIRYDRNSLEQAAPVVALFSRLEQLDAHGRSLTVRLEEPER